MCRYLANRPAILSGLRVALHAFLAYFVCHQPVESYKWLDTGGLGPLCVIPMGLMVSFTPLPNLLTYTVQLGLIPWNVFDLFWHWVQLFDSHTLLGRLECTLPSLHVIMHATQIHLKRFFTLLHRDSFSVEGDSV